VVGSPKSVAYRAGSSELGAFAHILVAKDRRQQELPTGRSSLDLV
jgi:hypothetical protein